MTDRGTRLHANAEQQIAELIGLLSTLDAVTLRRPCPGREKLGDGTVAALARHTADNYQRIAAFVADRVSGAHELAQDGAHRGPRLLRALGHGPSEPAGHGLSASQHGDQYTAGTTNARVVVKQLSDSHERLGRIAELTDSQLDAIPPKGSFRFCDGQRSLEQVLSSLLKHQRHQVDALNTAVAEVLGAMQRSRAPQS